jgi:hypothetical protein
LCRAREEGKKEEEEFDSRLHGQKERVMFGDIVDAPPDQLDVFTAKLDRMKVKMAKKKAEREETERQKAQAAHFRSKLQ